MRNIEKYEQQYCDSDFEQMYQVPYRRKKIQEIIQRVKHDRILEVGCGMQSIAGFIDDYKEFTVVEPGENFIKNAEKALPDKHAVLFVQGFLEEQLEKLGEREYDLIIVSSLLHEIESPMEMLKAVQSLCCNDTLVHINVPNMNSMHRVLALESGFIQSLDSKSQRNISLQQNNGFDLDKLIRFVSFGADVEILEKGSYFIKPFSHGQMEKCLKYGIITEKVLDGFYELTKYMPEMGSEIYINYKYKKTGSGCNGAAH